MKLFVDRDLGPAIGRALQAVGVDAVNHVEVFRPDEDDAVWIRAVTAEERVILSKDKHLRSRPAEREAFEAAGARCFVLTSEGQNRLSLLRNLLASWDEIAAREATVPAPFMYGIARDGRLTQWIPRGGEGSPTERARATEARRRSRRGGPLQDDLTRG